jgi:hypothetical protein
MSQHDRPRSSEPLTPKSDEPSPDRPDANPSPPELSVGVRHGADGSTDVRTHARGVPSILAYVAVLLMLIVVGGFVAVFAITRPQHDDPPRRETQGCTERIERFDATSVSPATSTRPARWAPARPRSRRRRWRHRPVLAADVAQELGQLAEGGGNLDQLASAGAARARCAPRSRF